MAPALQVPSVSQTPQLSPAELSYLHTSLSFPNNPVRPDGRSATQFRPLMAETSILPGANGSARIGFADGTEAIVGVKAEVEKTAVLNTLDQGILDEFDNYAGDEDGMGGLGTESAAAKKLGGQRRAGGQSSWIEISIDIPGLRDDDSLSVFLAEMMREALTGSGSESDAFTEGQAKGLKRRLVINQGWHWRMYIDILLLSPPLSYPLPLLSLTTHLALLSTKLPKLKSQDKEDPMFDDDWGVAEYLYPRASASLHESYSFELQQQRFRPPITLLVVSVGENIIFDPSREEISVAEAVLAISIERSEQAISKENTGSNLRLLSIRTIDPPSRMTNPGIPNSENAAIIGFDVSEEPAQTTTVADTAISGEEIQGVWKPRRGGVKRGLISRIVKMVLQKGGVGDEVMEGLEGVEVQ